MGAESIVEELGASIDDGEIPLRIHNDPEIHRLELERIFGQTWVFIGHETEIPEPGDYAVRYIGRDPFIFVRDSTGEIRVHFDSCRHRGTTVCRADRGNTSHFRCPYHGWTYKNTGELVGIPHNQAYENLDKSDWGLRQAHVDTYNGLVFATIAADPPSLVDYLGGMTWYLDIQTELFDGGMRVIGEPHRWEIDANWKVGADNFAGDSDHTETAHYSVFQVGLVAAAGDLGPRERFEYFHHVTECDGHAMSLGMRDPEAEIYFGYPRALLDTEALSPEQTAIGRRSFLNFGTIFPNLSFIHVSPAAARDKPDRGFLSLRQWQPKSPDTMEMWNWVLVPATASETYAREAYQTAVNTFSPSGNFEADDIEIWRTITRAAGSVFAGRSGMTLNYQQGLEPAKAIDPVEDWPGPGVVYNEWLEEGVMRTFYRSWYEHMRPPDGAEA